MSFGQLLQQQFVHTALIAGAVVSIVSGAVGMFVVMRGMSFAVHAVSELGFTCAAAALLAGISPVAGLLGGSLVVGAVLGLLTVRGRERDAAIGSFLAFGLGVGVLLITLYVQHKAGSATAATNLLFGNIVGVSASQVLVLSSVAALVLAALAFVYRPLLFASVDPDGAEARGVSLRLMSVILLLLVALTTAEAIQVVGVLLVLTLVITPAAAATQLTARPALAMWISIAVALVASEGGILLSLAPPWQTWPPSFFISTISFVAYVAARIVGNKRRSASARTKASPSQRKHAVLR